jgi:3-methyladenine DNA glycosylase AlkC
MAEPLKHLIDAALVRRMAAPLQRACPAFDARRFVATGTTGLETLELKARAMQLADALEATLPTDFEAAAAAIEAALAPPWPDDRLGSDDPGHDGLEGWALWPVGEYVARRGLAEPRRALATLHALTQRFSAEFAIRPFIAAHPTLAFETLQRWTRDPSAHVRRLVSEGSRPRLPWGIRLQALVADPTPTLPLLRALQDDGSGYVRRSVANHLNDIAKDHPALVADWLAEHLPGAPPERRSLLRHASRTLIKQGDRRVLAAWGLGGRLRGSATLSLTPGAVALGGSVDLVLTLGSRATTPQRLAIDYAVHHVKADGSTRPKVFKGWTLTLPPRQTLTLRKRHALKPVTTRRYHAGEHTVDVQVNGVVAASASFTLSLP